MEADDLGVKEELSEFEKIMAWRFSELLGAGYPLALAQQLAIADVDLHRACDLLTNGCSTEKAAEILL